MAIVPLPNQLTDGTVADAAQVMANFNAILNTVNGGIDNFNLSPSIGITDTKLSQIQSAGKVNGMALTNFAGIPSGAGIIPAANLIYQNIQYPYIKITNTQSRGTNGGSLTGSSSAFQTLLFNNTETDTQSISSLSSNMLTLPAGSYTVRASTPIINPGNNVTAQIRLFNSTGSAVLLNGQVCTGATGNQANFGTVTSLIGYFTLSTSSAIVFQIAASINSDPINLGLSGGFGTEIFAMAEFTKVL